MIFEGSSWCTILESSPLWMDELCSCLANDWRRLAGEMGVEEKDVLGFGFDYLSAFKERLSLMPMTEDEIVDCLETGN